MTVSLPKIHPVREQKAAKDEPIQPFKCFCCADSGLVSNKYSSEFIENPQSGDRPFICRNTDCDAGMKYMRCYGLSDAERTAYAFRDRNNPVPVCTAVEYRAAFGVELTEVYCINLHERSSADWLEDRSIAAKNKNYGNNVVEFARNYGT